MRAMEPRWCTLVLGVVLAGCPASSAKKVEKPEAIDSAVAAKGAAELVKEIYGDLRRGATGGLLPLVDLGVLAVGPGPGDLFTDRSAALVALAAAVPEGKHKLTSKNLHVGASPAGHAAWASDLILLDGKPYVIGMILLEADELWTVAAVEIGSPLTKKQLDKLLETGPVAAPTPVPPPTGGGDKVLGELFAVGAATPEALADQVAKNPDAVARDVAGRPLIGFRAIRKAWKKSMKGVTTAPHGTEPVAARLAPDGTMGWVFGTVDVTAPKDPTVPTRMLHVYEKTDDGWGLVLTSPSIAQPR